LREKKRPGLPNIRGVKSRPCSKRPKKKRGRGEVGLKCNSFVRPVGRYFEKNDCRGRGNKVREKTQPNDVVGGRKIQISPEGDRTYKGGAFGAKRVGKFQRSLKKKVKGGKKTFTVQGSLKL